MKKYLTFDFISGMVLMIGLTVVSVALVCVGFTWDDNPVWLQTAMRVVGFAGTIVFPVVTMNVVRDFLSEEGE